MQSNWPTALTTSQSTRSLHSQESTPVEEETPTADGTLQEFVEIETATISEKVRTLQIAYNDYVEAEQVKKEMQWWWLGCEEVITGATTESTR